MFRTNSLLFWLLGLLLVMDCKKNDFQTSLVNQDCSKELVDVSTMILGEKLENPYSVKNMQKAYNNLLSAGEVRQKSKIDMTTTHYYVRFLPKNETEFELLKSDTTIFLYDYPLDTEIQSQGSYYHDPSLPDSAITWQYTVVPVGFNYPAIQYEVLSDLFLNDDNQQKALSIPNALYKQIEEESFILTGNNEGGLDPTAERQVNTKSASWTPSGYVKVYDDLLGWQPVVGVKVRARSWFKTLEAVTDLNGFYVTGSFNDEVNYSIKWEYDDKFDLRSGNYGQAYTNGPKMIGPWNQSFAKDNFYWAYATIFRASHIYYTQNGRWGIKTPPYQRGLFNSRLHIGVHDNTLGSPHYFHWNQLVLSSQIDIYAEFGDDKYTDFTTLFSYNHPITHQKGDGLFAITIHELAHASHWEIKNQTWNWVDQNNGGRFFVESWATGVETVISSTIYPMADYTKQRIQKAGGQQNNGYSEYSPIVEDMMDYFNQSCYETASNPCPNGGLNSNIGQKFGKNCFACKVGQAPSGTIAFVYPANNGSFYHSSLPGNNCPSPAWFDGANCYFSDIPTSWYGFVLNNKFYLDATSSGNYPVDHVEGYTLQQLELALNDDPKSAGEWKTAVKNNWSNPTKNYLDELFGNYGY